MSIIPAALLLLNVYFIYYKGGINRPERSQYCVNLGNVSYAVFFLFIVLINLAPLRYVTAIFTYCKSSDACM